MMVFPKNDALFTSGSHDYDGSKYDSEFVPHLGSIVNLATLIELLLGRMTPTFAHHVIRCIKDY